MAGIAELKAAIVDLLNQVEHLVQREVFIFAEHEVKADLQSHVDTVKQLQADVVAAVVPPEAPAEPEAPAGPVAEVVPVEAPVAPAESA